MADKDEFMRNMKFHKELFEFLIIKLSAIVSDDGMWQSKFIYNRLLNEIFYLTFSDLCQGFSFHLFGEIIHGNYQKLSLTNR